MLELRKFLDSILSWICMFLLAFMSCLAMYQVFARYVLHNPSTISEDILSFSFVWLSLLATTLVFGKREHMEMSYFAERLGPDMHLCLQIFSEVLIMTVAVIVFFFGGLGFMGVGALQISPAFGIPMSWIYVVLPICGIMTVIYNILNILMLIRNRSVKDGKETS